MRTEYWRTVCLAVRKGEFVYALRMFWNGIRYG